MEEGQKSFGVFLLDRERQALLRDGEPVPIGHRGYLILEALLDAHGGTVGKTALLERAWPGLVVEEANLTVQIGNLRKAMGADGEMLIVTVPRTGYRLVRPSQAHAAIPPAPAVATIAVMPFANLSGDAAQDYFADGMVDDIITALSRFRSFTVASRQSSFVYKGRAVDIRQIANELSVRYVLEGSVRRVGKRVRVNAQLIDGVSGDHLWAHNFDGVIEDIFDVQDRITAGVAALVAPTIEKAEIERARRERPGNLTAHDLYLQALGNFATARPDDNAEAIDLLDRATALDPKYAPALALAAHCREHRSTMGWPAIGADDQATALDMARRALDLSSDDGATMARCGMVLLFVGRDFDRAVLTLERAMALNPNHEVVVVNAGIAHMMGGSLEKAEEYYLRAIDMAFNEGVALGGMAWVNLFQRRYEDALSWAARSLAITPNFNANYWTLIAANAYLGHGAEARRWLAALNRVSSGVTLARIRKGQSSKDPSRFEILLEGLRLGGMPEG
jgi:TolB-like protein/Tfp pilus assembly protein PilF